MFFTLKPLQSKRFVRFNFRQLGLERVPFLGLVLRTLWDFFRTIISYIVRRLKLYLGLLGRLLVYLGTIPQIAKRELVRKLIWSRGRLGRPIATGIILATSLLVFFIGEFLSGLSFVVQAEANADYLNSTVDIIAKKEVTTTEIPEIRKRVEPFNYVIEGGDTLYGIGEKFKVSTDALKYVNNLTDSSVLTVGAKIVIPPVSGLVHTVKSGDTLNSIATKYDVPAQAIADFNYLLDTTKLSVGSDLVIPGAKVPDPVVPIYTIPAVVGPANYGAASPSKNFCVWPTTVRIVSQGFSWYHNGADIATPWSGGMPPIFACTGGTVVRAGWDPWGLGLHIRIDHGNGYTTVYGHMSRLDVKYGQQVSRGQVLGLMGSTGRSTGPHVHFMVNFNGVPQNPFSYMN
jgi:LysM repeat protein